MCILFIAFQQRHDLPLIIAANRDEFHARPTEPSHFWSPGQTLYAGRDLQAGGTWMGVTRNGNLAALTNIREPHNQNPQARSRGELPADYLRHPEASHTTLARLIAERQHYNGYNLLFGHWQQPGVYNNRHNHFHRLTPGIHGLSNAELNSPWPKVTKGMQSLTQYCRSTTHVTARDLFTLLRNDEQAEDDALPDTGIGYEWEKRLSSIFIRSADYGTRSATVLLVDASGQAHWQERTFNADGQVVGSRSQDFQFSLAGR